MKRVLLILSLFLISFININASTINYNLDNTYILSEPTLNNFGTGEESCSDILGPTMTEIVKLGIDIVRIGGAIIAIVNGMLKLIPAIMSKDANALKKATDKCITMTIVLAVICLFPTILHIIGTLFKFDMSCFV